MRVENIDLVLDQWESEPSARGAPRLDVRDFERTLLDGRIARWRLGSTSNLELPFLLQDVSDITIRVPPRTASHPNGACGLDTLWLAALNANQARQNFMSVFDSLSSQEAYLNAADARVQWVATPDFAGKFALTLRAEVPEPLTLDTRQTFGTTIRLAAVG